MRGPKAWNRKPVAPVRDRGSDAGERADGAGGEIEAPGAGRQVGDDDDGEDADSRAGDAAENLRGDEHRISRR